MPAYRTPVNSYVEEDARSNHDRQLLEMTVETYKP